MKVNPTLVLYLAAGAAGVFVAWRLWSLATKGVTAAADAAAAAADAAVTVIRRDLNPAADTNLANRAVTAAGQAITGDQGWTLGGWLYELTHADPLAAPVVTRVADGGRPMVDYTPVWGAPQTATFEDLSKPDPFRWN